jgi:hypothetical protein
VVAVGLFFLLGPRVSRANAERIKPGMTKAEVLAILGKPWDDSLLDAEALSYQETGRLGRETGTVLDLVGQRESERFGLPYSVMPGPYPIWVRPLPLLDRNTYSVRPKRNLLIRGAESDRRHWRFSWRGLHDRWRAGAYPRGDISAVAASYAEAAMRPNPNLAGKWWIKNRLAVFVLLEDIKNGRVVIDLDTPHYGPSSQDLRRRWGVQRPPHLDLSGPW